ncbi:hypothetical protein FB565_008251 [Actinoplanes lutulentus]|uniref:hypothetical protein n=1 Tax=Actinoplanes lutulentus TaxID=1287878 RepID=UPI0011B945F0|nr:hypothetical protein [Actinoplanes lutulentus]MBB2948468.1 hypothetical protein [Actinoplanes lutulentus]
MVLSLVAFVPIFKGGGVSIQPASPVLACPTVDLKATPEPGPQQSHPAPRPSEACGAAAARLTGVLSTALRSDVPAFAWNTKRLQYETLVELPQGGKIQVRIIAGHEYPDRASSQCPEDADWDCSYTVTDDKTIVIVADTGTTFQAETYRKDGTGMLILATKEIMTRNQLVAVAGNPGLTLFP